jgi:hypothetical protein
MPESTKTKLASCNVLPAASPGGAGPAASAVDETAASGAVVAASPIGVAPRSGKRLAGLEDRTPPVLAGAGIVWMNGIRGRGGVGRARTGVGHGVRGVAAGGGEGEGEGSGGSAGVKAHGSNVPDPGAGCRKIQPMGAPVAV